MKDNEYAIKFNDDEDWSDIDDEDKITKPKLVQKDSSSVFTPVVIDKEKVELEIIPKKCKKDNDTCIKSY